MARASGCKTSALAGSKLGIAHRSGNKQDPLSRCTLSPSSERPRTVSYGALCPVRCRLWLARVLPRETRRNAFRQRLPDGVSRRFSPRHAAAAFTFLCSFLMVITRKNRGPYLDDRAQTMRFFFCFVSRNSLVRPFPAARPLSPRALRSRNLMRRPRGPARVLGEMPPRALVRPHVRGLLRRRPGER